jgi:hypothetical protein
MSRFFLLLMLIVLPSGMLFNAPSVAHAQDADDEEVWKISFNIEYKC